MNGSRADRKKGRSTGPRKNWSRDPGTEQRHIFPAPPTFTSHPVMKTVASTHDLFFDQLRDLFSMESQIALSLPKLGATAGDERLRRVFLPARDRHGDGGVVVAGELDTEDLVAQREFVEMPKGHGTAPLVQPSRLPVSPFSSCSQSPRRV